MAKYFSLLFTALLWHWACIGQDSLLIKGQVINKTTGAPLANCSVFINNSSRGTISDASGHFELRNIPRGKHELIVSSIGYETYALSFSEKDLPLEARVQLSLKAAELDAVTVAPFEKNGWQKWGSYFLQNFIGTTKNSADCRIKNTRVIKFRYSSRQNILTAVADEPLIIENKALGYTITYQLEEFTSNFKERSIAYYGYPLFKSMETKRKGLEKRWNENRMEAYHGSVMHFMKSLYRSDLLDQGFTVRPILKIENTEKKRVKEIFRIPLEDTLIVQRDSIESWHQKHPISSDSMAYYEKILRQEDFFSVLGPVIPADSLISLNADGDRSLFFAGTLSVYYANAVKKVDRRSGIRLMTPAPVVIEPNGAYYPAQEFFTMGDWGFSEKLSNLLPSDYQILEEETIRPKG